MTATLSKPVSVTYNDLSDAYEYVSSAPPSEMQAYLCRNTGKIYYVSDYEDSAELDEVPDDIADSDQYISIPHKYDLDLGRDLIFSFVDQELPNQGRAVSDMFRRKGAYRRFKEMLQKHRMLDKWYAFEASAVEKALRDWCEDNDIQVSDP
jgi:Uncharacterised protein family (UPF0158)